MPKTHLPYPLRVLYLSAEAEPFVKVGGLGEVAGSLPAALRALYPPPLAVPPANEIPDHPAVDIRLVLPYYPTLKTAGLNIRPVISFNVSVNGENVPVEAYDCEMKGVPVYLISGPPIGSDPVYSGDPLRDGRKFVFFSLAALELARALGWQPHILHANDWHTAPAVYALHLSRPGDAFFKSTASLLSLHNLPYLGVGVAPAMEEFGLPSAAHSALPWWAQQLPLPVGLLTANALVAVSPTYAEEILTPQFGSGLDVFLQTRKANLSGILNGLDMESWNPATDPQLVLNYDLENLAPRATNKAALQQELGLPVAPDLPLLAMVSRFDNQKGVDLAVKALRTLAGPPSAFAEAAQPAWQAVLLGTGQPDLENLAAQLQADYPDQIRAIIKYDAALSRRIYASSDAFLIPSRYEPCGLTQMSAMRYGSVPIARATGGLKDTIQDPQTNPKTATGFLFSDDSPAALQAAIERALEMYTDQRRWRALQRHGMQQDFSWERSARQYLRAYAALVK